MTVTGLMVTMFSKTNNRKSWLVMSWTAQLVLTDYSVM